MECCSVVWSDDFRRMASFPTSSCCSVNFIALVLFSSESSAAAAAAAQTDRDSRDARTPISRRKAHTQLQIVFEQLSLLLWTDVKDDDATTTDQGLPAWHPVQFRLPGGLRARRNVQPALPSCRMNDVCICSCSVMCEYYLCS